MVNGGIVLFFIVVLVLRLVDVAVIVVLVKIQLVKVGAALYALLALDNLDIHKSAAPAEYQQHK